LYLSMTISGTIGSSVIITLQMGDASLSYNPVYTTWI
jgi:hypothetical protein